MLFDVLWVDGEFVTRRPLVIATLLTYLELDGLIEFVDPRGFYIGQSFDFFLANPEFGVDLHPIDFAAFARACGGTGFTIEDPAACGRILDQALATPGPVVVEAIVDPHEPPLPAKITLEQATMFAESLARGQPNRTKIAWTVLSEKVRELV